MHQGEPIDSTMTMQLCFRNCIIISPFRTHLMADESNLRLGCASLFAAADAVAKAPRDILELGVLDRLLLAELLPVIH